MGARKEQGSGIQLVEKSQNWQEAECWRRAEEHRLALSLSFSSWMGDCRVHTQDKVGPKPTPDWIHQ